MSNYPNWPGDTPIEQQKPPTVPIQFVVSPAAPVTPVAAVPQPDTIQQPVVLNFSYFAWSALFKRNRPIFNSTSASPAGSSLSAVSS